MTRLPPVVELAVFGVSAARVPAALWHMGADRRALAATPGLRFAKLLGTGYGRTFDVRDADPRTWAVLTVWDHSDDHDAWRAGAPVLAGWEERATTSLQVVLRPVATKGAWSGRQPFTPVVAGAPDGEVAAITRARLRPHRAAAFWRSVPPVAAATATAPGLRLAIGIGEAPIGLQGTFSVWRGLDDLRAFAYGDPAHRAVMADTRRRDWYAEDLFARFAVVRRVGSLPPRHAGASSRPTGAA